MTNDGRLTISGDRRPPPLLSNTDPTLAMYPVKEFKYGRFERTINVPAGLQVCPSTCFITVRNTLVIDILTESSRSRTSTRAWRMACLAFPGHAPFLFPRSHRYQRMSSAWHKNALDPCGSIDISRLGEYPFQDKCFFPLMRPPVRVNIAV